MLFFEFFGQILSFFDNLYMLITFFGIPIILIYFCSILKQFYETTNK